MNYTINVHLLIIEDETIFRNNLAWLTANINRMRVKHLIIINKTLM